MKTDDALTGLISKAYTGAIDARRASSAYQDVADAIRAEYKLTRICRHEWGPTMRELGSDYESRRCANGCRQSRLIDRPWPND